jgi:hypothetical protein
MFESDVKAGASGSRVTDPVHPGFASIIWIGKHLTYIEEKINDDTGLFSRMESHSRGETE